MYLKGERKGGEKKESLFDIWNLKVPYWSLLECFPVLVDKQGGFGSGKHQAFGPGGIDNLCRHAGCYSLVEYYSHSAHS